MALYTLLQLHYHWINESIEIKAAKQVPRSICLIWFKKKRQFDIITGTFHICCWNDIVMPGTSSSPETKKKKLYIHNDYDDNEFNNAEFIEEWNKYTLNSKKYAYNRPLESIKVSFEYMKEIYLSIIIQNIIIPYLTFDTINLINKDDLKSILGWELFFTTISFVLISFILKSFKYTFIIFITILQLSPIIKNLNKTTDFNTVVNISCWLSVIIVLLKSIYKNGFKNNHRLSFKEVIVINLQLTNIIIMSSRFNKLLQVALYLLINIQLQILIPLKYSQKSWFKKVNYAILIFIIGVNNKFRHTQRDYKFSSFDKITLLLYLLIVAFALNITVFLKYSFTNHIIRNKIDKKNIPFFQSWDIRLPST